MRYLYSAALLIAGVSACGGGAKTNTPAAADQPAVIAVPLDVPKPKTEQPAAHTSSIIPANPRDQVMVIYNGYSLMTATMLHQDSRVLGSLFAPDAQLHTPDGTYSGLVPVTRRLIELSRSKSLADFQRTSRSVNVVDDSTLVDSGAYVMTSKRMEKDSTVERGQYVTKWRVRKVREPWVILDDALMPGAPGASRRKAK